MRNKLQVLFVTLFLIVLGFVGMEKIGFTSSEKFHAHIIKNYPEQFIYQRRNNTGREIIVKKGDKQYDHLFTWISAKRDGWKLDYITYAPDNYFHAEQMNVNVGKSMVVINVTPKDRKTMIQMTRRIEQGDNLYQILNQTGEINQ